MGIGVDAYVHYTTALLRLLVARCHAETPTLFLSCLTVVVSGHGPRTLPSDSGCLTTLAFGKPSE